MPICFKLTKIGSTYPATLSMLLGLSVLARCLFLDINPCCAREAKVDSTVADTMRTMERVRFDLDMLKDRVEEVRKGQMNYQIERDILKETYSTNLMSLDMAMKITLLILTTVGLFITIVGFLGVKSIFKSKKEFEGELEKLKGIREQYEPILSELKEANQTQDNRLKVLEVQEKGFGLISNGNFSRALEFIKVGLTIDPQDLTLLNQKFSCELRTREFGAAVKTCVAILEIEPNDTSALLNLLEAYLLNKDFPGYTNFMSNLSAVQRALILHQFGEFAFWYLDVLFDFVSGNVNEIKSHVRSPLVQTSEGKGKKRITSEGWSFREARVVADQEGDSPRKKIFLSCIEFLEGNIDSAVLTAAANAT